MRVKSVCASAFALILLLSACSSAPPVTAPPASPPGGTPLPPPPPPPPSVEAKSQDILVTGAKILEGQSIIGAFLGVRHGSGAIFGNIIGPRPPIQDTERYRDVAPNSVKAVATEPVSTFSIDVDTASYGLVRSYLQKGAAPPRDGVRIEELLNYFDYDYPLPSSREDAFRPFIAMAPSPWGEGKTLLHIGLQGFAEPPRERAPLNLVLLLDVSGSMDAANKLPLVKQSVQVLTEQLTARDRVSIAVYAGAAGTVLEPTPGNEKAKILGALDGLKAGGSTAGGEGLALAYSLAERNFDRASVNRVLIATDGDFNVGVTSDQRLEDFVAGKRETGIYLTVLGYGRGNYNDALMQTLAQKGNGNAAYIDTLAEARKVLHDEIQASLFPIADDVKIQVEFNPEQVAEYRLIGYETRALAREDFANDRVDAGEVGSGASVTAIYELTPIGGKTLFEPLRYQNGARPADAVNNGEIAFLRVRYKAPGGSASRIYERPITAKDSFASLAAAPEATRFAAAVAGYGQLLRGDPYLDKGFGYAKVIDLANGAKGNDAFGWRAEFVQLARAAGAAKPLPAEDQPG